MFSGHSVPNGIMNVNGTPILQLGTQLNGKPFSCLDLGLCKSVLPVRLDFKAYCFLLKLSEKATRKRIDMSFRSIMLGMTDVFMH